MDGDLSHPVRHSSVVGDNGEVTLPHAVREQLDLAEGDRVYMYPSLSGGIVLRKAIEDDYTRRLDALRGIAGPGPSTDEIMEMTRGGVA